MKIKIGQIIYKPFIRIGIEAKPDIEQLKQEIETYLMGNTINERKAVLDKFRSNYDVAKSSFIVCIYPELDESLSAGEYDDFFEILQKKYRIRHIGFPYYYYGK